MSKGLLVENRWVDIPDDETIAKGTKVKIKAAFGGGRGEVVGVTPSGKMLMVKTGRGMNVDVKSFHQSDLQVKKAIFAEMLAEFNMADPTGFNTQGSSDPDMTRLNAIRYRIATLNQEAAKLQEKIAKKQMQNTQQQQQQRPAQQQQGQQLQPGQGFPNLRPK